MTNEFARGMARATELTRAGKLDEATALIQSLMQPKSSSKDIVDDSFIEGTCTDVSEAAPSATTPPRDRNTTMRSPGKGLHETLRNMASGGLGLRAARDFEPVNLPDGAQFLSLRHSSLQGSRNYRLYVPAKQPQGQMPLIVMLHGCIQTPEDFAVGTGMNTLAEEFGCLVAWPSQPNTANAQKCWNWFRPEDQRRDQGEPALIAGIVRDVLREQPADPSRVYVAGLSAGGAAAAILGVAYPELFAAVGVHSGLPVGSARDVPSAFAAMQGGASGGGQHLSVPTIVVHGSADSTVHPSNADAVVDQALLARSGLNRVIVSGTSAGGRRYRQTRHNDDTGCSVTEQWDIDGAGHAWSGGQAKGSYTDPRGPNASYEMLRFFLQHSRI